MAHRTDPDRRYIDAGIARLEAVANTTAPHANRLEQLQHELIAAAARRSEAVAAIAEARRARRTLVVAAAASAAAGLTFMVLVAVGITIARHLLW
jgi:hypothetical protein